MRLTEQGEIISLKFANADIGRRNLETGDRRHAGSLPAADAERAQGPRHVRSGDATALDRAFTSIAPSSTRPRASRTTSSPPRRSPRSPT
ncbi:hypothetical protein ACU4GD_15560 [Cupriavidus basilensis]